MLSSVIHTLVRCMPSNDKLARTGLSHRVASMSYVLGGESSGTYHAHVRIRGYFGTVMVS
ncbi:hypothetical protein CAT723_21920 [Corynebacterium ammoniagenes]|uniref:Uncharacterized protein n=1 Tax=Corynebacterium ammoniagenes TaxID=1697 RepID=A0AAV5GAH2_CORAM|nr:hypothetical protein CAT723_21920 [Corynebacterium ammoniagenes]